MSTRSTIQPLAEAWPSGHLIGLFELRGTVARNASGIVYQAWDDVLGIAVAVKEHLPAALAQRLADGTVRAADAPLQAAWEASLQDFVEGSRLLARCDHPSSVRVLQLQRAHGTAFRVMAWVDGETLRETRRRLNRPFDEPTLYALLDDLLDALDAVHRVAGVHGGVHPDQILITAEGRPVLLGPNFGIVDEGVAAGPWTDLRALAGVARFCITGMLPGPDDGPAEPTAAVVERLFFDDPSVRYGPALMALLDDAVALEVARRPQSVSQFCGRLERARRADAAAAATDGADPAGSEAGLTRPAAPLERPAGTATATRPPRLRASLIERLSGARPDADTAVERSEPTLGVPADVADAAVAAHRFHLSGGPTVRPGQPAPAAAVADQPTASRHAGPIGWAVAAALVVSLLAAAWLWRPPGEPVPATDPSPVTLAPPAATPTTPAAAPDALAAAPPAATPLPNAAGTPPAPLTDTAPAVDARAPDGSAPPPPDPAPAAAAPNGTQTRAEAAPRALPPPAMVAPAGTELAPTPSGRPAAGATTPQTRAVTTAPRVATGASPPTAITPATPGASAPTAMIAERSAGAAAPDGASTSAAAPRGPREACGSRTNFALYYCMQQQCAISGWADHPTCVRFKATDEVE